MKQNKEEKFEKVVKYYYPHGKEFDENIFSWYLTSFIIWIIWIIMSPFTFFSSDWCGMRKVYWRKIK